MGSDHPSGTIPVLLENGLHGKPEGSVVGACREPRSSLEPVMFDVIERLKSEWTDKYVVVSSPAPELARFSRTTGIVKTVNMNGRCLVEFDQFNNTGWYDIDPACLKIVAKPEPKPAAAKEPKAAPAAKAPVAPKPAAPKPAAPKPAAADKPAAKPAVGGKPSTADILAAARAKAAGGASPAAAAKPAGGKPSTADILAAARAKGGAPAAKPAGDEGTKPAGAKPSTAEILARARAAKAATPPAPEAAEEPSESVPAAPVAKPAATAKPAAGGALPTTTAEKLAWCRAHDAHA